MVNKLVCKVYSYLMIPFIKILEKNAFVLVHLAIQIRKLYVASRCFTISDAFLNLQCSP